MGKKRKKRCYCGIGGQAVLEGVMMKNQDSYAVAVRRPDGEIGLKKEDYKGIWGDKKITKIPFLRGVFNFIDSLVLGMSTLTWSAQFFEEDEPEKNIADQKKKAKKPEQKETVSDAVTENVDGKADATDTKEKKSGAAESIAVGGTVALSILMAVAIFIVLPYFLSMLFSHYVLNESLLAIVEGVLRIVIFVAYVAGISAMKDIRRVYMYHGAEHKCINCIEKGRPLTGKAAIEALEPFALGFLEAAQTWPGILDTNSRAVARSLHGVLRHLPEEALGDFAQVKTILDKEAPLEDLPSALSDMVSCLAEIAHETKGYDLPELNEPEEGEEKA